MGFMILFSAARRCLESCTSTPYFALAQRLAAAISCFHQQLNIPVMVHFPCVHQLDEIMRQNGVIGAQFDRVSSRAAGIAKTWHFR
jgi:hypothetical protein